MNKICHVYNFMISQELSVLVVCETWLTAETPSSFVDLPGFNFFRSDSGDGIRKHGVGMYVSAKLTSSEVEVAMKNVLIVYLEEWSIYLVAVYRPPSYLENDNECLISFLSEYCYGRNVILLGDFNLPSIKWSEEYTLNGYVNPLDMRFYETFLECGLVQWIRDSTFVTSGNTLDLIFTSEIDSVGQYEIFPPFPNCHHSPVVISYLPAIKSQDSRSSPPRLCWVKGNYEEITEELLQVDWGNVLDGNADECYEGFLRILESSVKRHVPKSNVGSYVPPWLREPPRSLSRSRSQLWANYKNIRASYGRRDSRSQAALESFMEVNRCFRNYSIEQRVDYETRITSSISSAPKLFHSYIRNKKKSRSAVGPLKIQGNLLSHPTVVSEALADYFESVFDPSVPDAPSSHQGSISRMEIPNITYDLVLEQLQSLDANVSPGPDNMHPILLKSCAVAIAYPLLLIFKKSLLSGRVPIFWKFSLVIPLFKGGSKFSPNNYRPISLTCVTSKVMERILANYIMLYLGENELISPNQFGFRSGRGTEDQLLGVYGRVCEWVDAGESVDVVFLDYSKAFDRVSHSLLIEKLYLLGFNETTVEWIRSFLVGRSMKVLVGGVCSGERTICSGVPQGTVLGPVLFLIFVNSVASGISCHWKAFADDFKLYMSYGFPGNSGDVSVSVLQHDLDTINRVSSSWNLKLNISKCVAMRFGRRRCDDSDLPIYKINGENISLKDHTKDLGIIIDEKLRFHQHVRTVVGRAGRLIGDLLRSTVCRSPKFMLTLFVTHIRPIIEYCSSVWNVGYLGDIRSVEALQRRWTKEIDGMAGVRYEDRLRMLDLSSIRGRLLRKDLVSVERWVFGRY